MIHSPDSKPRLVQDLPSAPNEAPRKTYGAPVLVEWGSLVDLTRGSIPNSIEDPDMMGTSIGL